MMMRKTRLRCLLSKRINRSSSKIVVKRVKVRKIRTRKRRKAAPCLVMSKMTRKSSVSDVKRKT